MPANGRWDLTHCLKSLRNKWINCQTTSVIIIVVFGSDLEQRKNKTKPVSKRLQDRMHRLECLRFWLLHSVNSIHSYLMGQMLQVLSMELERNIEQARDLSMLIKGKGSLFVNSSIKTAQHRLLQIVHPSLKHIHHLFISYSPVCTFLSFLQK